jgi:hypothetical protein
MTNIVKFALTAAAIAFGSTASAAVVIFTPAAGPSPSAPPPIVESFDLTGGQLVTAAEVLLPDQTASYTFKALNSLTVSDIAFGGTGNNAGADLGSVTFGLTSPPTNSFSSIVVSGTSSAGTSFLPGFTVAGGDSFTIFYADGISAPVSVDFSFSTTPVPVPAALPLLIGGVAALGAVARKKKAKA